MRRELIQHDKRQRQDIWQHHFLVTPLTSGLSKQLYSVQQFSLSLPLSHTHTLSSSIAVKSKIAQLLSLSHATRWVKPQELFLSVIRAECSRSDLIVSQEGKRAPRDSLVPESPLEGAHVTAGSCSRVCSRCATNVTSCRNIRLGRSEQSNHLQPQNIM